MCWENGEFVGTEGNETAWKRRDYSHACSKQDGVQLPNDAQTTRGRTPSNLPLIPAPARTAFGSVCRRSCGNTHNNTMAARWPPSRGGANIYARPAERVETASERILFRQRRWLFILMWPSVLFRFANSPNKPPR